MIIGVRMWVVRCEFTGWECVGPRPLSTWAVRLIIADLKCSADCCWFEVFSWLLLIWSVQLIVADLKCSADYCWFEVFSWLLLIWSVQPPPLIIADLKCSATTADYCWLFSSCNYCWSQSVVGLKSPPQICKIWTQLHWVEWSDLLGVLEIM